MDEWVDGLMDERADRWTFFSNLSLVPLQLTLKFCVHIPRNSTAILVIKNNIHIKTF